MIGGGGETPLFSFGLGSGNGRHPQITAGWIGGGETLAPKASVANLAISKGLGLPASGSKV